MPLFLPQAAVEAARTALATTRSRSAVLEKAWAAAAEQARAEQVGGAADEGWHLAALHRSRQAAVPIYGSRGSYLCLSSSSHYLSSRSQPTDSPPLVVFRLDCLQEARLEAQAQLEWTQKHVRELSEELAHAQVC